MAFLKCVGGAVVGATVGAAIWIGASAILNGPLGCLIVLIGVLTGVGVNRMSRNIDSDIIPAILAVLVALGGGLLARYNAVVMTMVPEHREFWDKTSKSSLDEESMIASMADEVILERQSRNEAIDWPDSEMTFEDATWKEDYPPVIWEAGRQRWTALSAEEQQDRIHARAAQVAEVIDGYQAPELRAAFSDSFSSWDLIWFGAALAAAFAIGGRFVMAG